LEAGDVVTANKYLLKPFVLKGLVIQGRQLGRTIGFPTANLFLSDLFKLIPADGVYSCRVIYKNEILKGVISIGNRPTFNDSKKSIEVHILNFNADIYDETIKVEFVDFIRSQNKFSNVEELIQQIKLDIQKATEHLS
jgi:riboflavin kinase/FMN adenylyltransferase